MNAMESLAKELEQEAKTTRTFLERLPPERLDWRPHAKSETLGGLAAHIVQCVSWMSSIFAGPELDFDPKTAKRAPKDSVPGLLASFDETVADAIRTLGSTGEGELDGEWTLKFQGRTIFAGRKKKLLVRGFVLSHLIHHRGQLSTYLRPMGGKVPSIYGGSADESWQGNAS